jgi:mono/diheme cytochrome c family protein
VVGGGASHRGGVDSATHGSQGAGGTGQVQIAPEEWVTITATIATVNRNGLTIETAGGEVMALNFGRADFWQSQDVQLAAGVTLPVVEAAPIDMSPEAIASGAKLYNILCTQCHGVEAYGTRLAPALNNQTFLSQTSDAAIQQIISGGVTGTSMPAWGGYLTQADIAAITAYLRNLELTAPTMATP